MKFSSKQDLIKTVYELMLRNRRTAGSYQYTVPSPQTYPYQWLWDSCFHAIILTYCNLDDAKKELLSLVSHQFDNGMIPHMIYWEKQTSTDFPVVAWGKEDTSSITQPPMLAYAVWQIYQQDKDKQFLKKIYPNLWHFYHYLLTDRDPRGHHLVGIINPDESGEDNSPRFDIPLGLSPIHSNEENFKMRLNLVEKNKTCNFDAPFCMKNFFWVKDVPFNAIMVKNLLCLSDISTEIGEKEDADYSFTQANLVKGAMRKLMVDHGIYWSTVGLDYQKVQIKTWAIFAPLFAKICTQDEAKRLVDEHLLNSSEFSSQFMVPTVSMDEPSFNPKGFWRGPVWIATNWFVYKGLKNYGFDSEAEKIYQSSLSLIEKSGFREHFDPQTGEGLGAQDFTWGGLIVDMQSKT